MSVPHALPVLQNPWFTETLVPLPKGHQSVWGCGSGKEEHGQGQGVTKVWSSVQAGLGHETRVVPMPLPQQPSRFETWIREVQFFVWSRIC